MSIVLPPYSRSWPLPPQDARRLHYALNEWGGADVETLQTKLHAVGEGLEVTLTHKEARVLENQAFERLTGTSWSKDMQALFQAVSRAGQGTDPEDPQLP